MEEAAADSNTPALKKKISVVSESHGQAPQIQGQAQGLPGRRSRLKKGNGRYKRCLPGKART